MSDGVHFAHRRHIAFIDDDEVHWDYAERTNDASSDGHHDPWTRRTDEEERKDRDERAAAMEIWDALPEQNRAWLELFLILPYENILDIEDGGDEIFRHPQIYTVPFDPNNGPFREHLRPKLETISQFDPLQARPDQSKRVEKFPRSE